MDPRTKGVIRRQRRRRSTSPSSSSHFTQPENDFGRYKKIKLAPRVAETPLPLQPAEPINVTPINIIHNVPENVLQKTKTKAPTPKLSFGRLTGP